MERIIGIDLGTTNSCVAVLEGGVPVVIPTREGSRTLPSMVGFAESGERLVGHIAKRQAQTNPEYTVFAVKRLMGRKHADVAGELESKLPYKLDAASNGDVRIKLRERSCSPSEISAVYLSTLRELAEDYLRAPVQRAVVTVPAYFDDWQRQATRDAGRIAGLEIERIINEPTAASLAYGLQRRGSRVIAIYDLGGGTFDISLLRLSNDVYEVLATSGDTYLGGEDFDLRLVRWLADEFQAEHDVDLTTDPLALQRLKEAAEKAKWELSAQEQADIQVPFISSGPAGPLHLERTLTRAKFEELVSDLVARTREPCSDALAQAGLRPEQIDEVLLVGGQTRTPLVQETVRQMFGREPDRSINPDEVVAMGAAVQAGVLSGEVKDMVLLDVTPLSIGIETRGGVMAKLIERNSTIPTRRSKIFTTVADNQSTVEVHVLQGERELAAYARSLGRFELIGIPPAPRGVPQIEVGIEIDSNGIVNVSAREQTTGREQRMIVTPAAGLTEGEVERLLREAEEFAERDRERIELSRARGRLSSLLLGAQKSFEEFGSLLDSGTRNEVEGMLLEARTARDGTSLAAIEASLGALQEASRILNQVIMGTGTGSWSPDSLGAERTSLDPGSGLGEGSSGLGTKPD